MLFPLCFFMSFPQKVSLRVSRKRSTKTQHAAAQNSPIASSEVHTLTGSATQFFAYFGKPHFSFTQPEYLYAECHSCHTYKAVFSPSSLRLIPHKSSIPLFSAPKALLLLSMLLPVSSAPLYAEKDFLKHSLINIYILRFLFIPLLQTDTAYTIHIKSIIPLKPSEHQQLR